MQPPPSKDIAEILESANNVPQYMPLTPIAHGVKLALRLPVLAFVRFPIPKQHRKPGQPAWHTQFMRVA